MHLIKCVKLLNPPDLSYAINLPLAESVLDVYTYHIVRIIHFYKSQA